MTKGEQHISIWFFVGLLLIVYGVLIFFTGLYGLYSPPARQVVLAELHAGIWWGALLLALGGIYSYYFFPGKRAGAGESEQHRAEQQRTGSKHTTDHTRGQGA